MSPAPVLGLLGPLQLTRDGQVVKLGGPKQRALLAYLAVHAGEPVELGSLVDAVWGDHAPAGAIRCLRTYVSTLRRILGSNARIHGEGGTYRLDLDDLTTDIDEFRRLVLHAAELDDPDEVEPVLRTALDLWRGDFLGDIDQPWTRGRSTAVEWERRNCLAGWAEAAIAGGRSGAAIGPLQDETALAPYDERLCRLLMQALYDQGRHVDALDAYRQLRARLGDDLALEPGPEVDRLEEHILLHRVPRRESADGRLPAPATALVGRAREVDDLVARSAEERLITLTGPGGVGKTRLAIEVGRRSAGSGTPAYLADLSTTGEGRDVDGLLAQALGVKPRPGADLLESLIRYLEGRRVMLIVDNCEHLARAAARAIATLLRSCPQLTILATSRSPLHVDGETEWPTPPLEVPDTDGLSAATLPDLAAVELLLQRAPTGFQVSDENAAGVADLCRHLDGLPLGLELAAPRLGTMTPAEIVDSLAASSETLLTTEGVATRHTTLEATVDWSFTLLDEDARRLLARLGVMVGWFRAEDAHAVCEPSASPTAVRASLTDLAGRSLVTADTTGARTRYRLLETIRRFATRRLGEGEEKLSTLRRHADHYASVAEREAERLLGPEEREAVGVLAMAHDNFRAVVERSIRSGEIGHAARIVASLPDAAYWRSHIELSRWSRWIWERTDPSDPLHRAICGAAARGAWVEGRFADAARYASAAGEEGVVIARCGHPDDVLADVALYRGDIATARAHYLQVAATAGASGDVTRLGWATYYLAVTSAVLGDPTEAVAASARAFDLARESANPTALAYALYAGGLAAKHRAPDAAITMFEEAVRLAEPVSNEWFAGVARMELASTTASHDDLGRGIGLFTEVIEHWHRAGDDTQLRHAWRYLVRSLHAAGRAEHATILAGALTSETTSSFTHPPRRVLEDLERSLGEARFTQLTVRGSVMSTSELVALSLGAIEAVSADGITEPDRARRRP